MELENNKAQLVSVIGAKLELANMLTAIETESDKRIEKLAVARNARARVEVLIRSIVSQIV